MLDCETLTKTERFLAESVMEQDNRDRIAIAVLKSSAMEDLKKDYLVKICECVFDITRTAEELIANGEIDPPEDDRELFFFIKDFALEFENEYQKDDVDDYFERITKCSVEALLDRFGNTDKKDT